MLHTRLDGQYRPSLLDRELSIFIHLLLSPSRKRCQQDPKSLVLTSQLSVTKLYTVFCRLTVGRIFKSHKNYRKVTQCITLSPSHIAVPNEEGVTSYQRNPNVHTQLSCEGSPFMGVDHPKQERGLKVKYHPTNNYGQYDTYFHYGWLFTLTSLHIQNSKTDLPIRSILTPTARHRRRCSTFTTGRTTALVMAVTITIVTLDLSRSNLRARIYGASTVALRVYITLNYWIYLK